MSRLGFHPEARAEFLESARYYQTQQPGLGLRFIEAVRTAAGLVAKYPELYREVEPGLRQCRIVRFPYGIVYRPRGDRLEVVAVMHLHRQPGYWRGRLDAD